MNSGQIRTMGGPDTGGDQILATASRVIFLVFYLSRLYKMLRVIKSNKTSAITPSVAVLQPKSPPEGVARTRGGPDSGAREKGHFGCIFRFGTLSCLRAARLLGWF